MALRHALRWLWACFLRLTGALWWAKTRLRQRRSIVVIALHRVIDDAEVSGTTSLAGMIVRRQTFAALAVYAASRFNAVDPATTEPPVRGRRLALAFTFDDGWIDNYHTAFRISLKTGVPMTVFICPGLLGLNRPFWPERVAAGMRANDASTSEQEIEAAIERLKRAAPDARHQALRVAVAEDPNVEGDGPDMTMSWPQIREMSRSGVTFGAHTQTHQLLPTLDQAAAREEIRASKEAVESALQAPCNLFSYPNGDHSAETRQLVAAAGFSRAFTTERGAWTPQTDPFSIPRRCVCEDDLVGPAGRFSAAMFEYTVCWTVFRRLPSVCAISPEVSRSAGRKSLLL
jgi:peptidoglycan/xylan/chitin deacetylase (PgdA/CDA1 family)